jgi:hypothetical protein
MMNFTGNNELMHGYPHVKCNPNYKLIKVCLGLIKI